MNYPRAMLTDSGGFQMLSLTEFAEVTEVGELRICIFAGLGGGSYSFLVVFVLTNYNEGGCKVSVSTRWFFFDTNTREIYGDSKRHWCRHYDAA